MPRKSTGARAKASTLEAAANALMTKATAVDTPLTPIEQSRVMNSLATVLQKLGKINDEYAEWDAMIDRILAALKPYPEALRAVRAVL